MNGRIHESAQFWRNAALSLQAELERVEARLAELEPPPAPWGCLSHREVEVLRFIAHGMTRRQIAERLGISPLTTRSHEIAAYRKLGVRNRTEAAIWAWRNGLVDIDDAWAVVAAMQGLRS